MKWRLIFVGILSIFLTSAPINAQLDLISYKPRQLKFKEVSTPLLGYGSGNSHVILTSKEAGFRPFSVIYRSPIHYTAFFCRMEVKTMNSLGIMIKVHAGDYDNYSGEVRYNHYRPQ